MSYTSVRNFSLLSTNDFWSLLQEANQMHVTARAKYLQLLKVCEERRVAFGDIRNHLLNEAKSSGLYRRDFKHKDQPKDSKWQYAPRGELKRRNEAWFVAMNNFLAWINRNYLSYAMRKPKAVKKAKEETSATIRRTTDADGNVTESRTDATKLIGTPEEVQSAIEPLVHALSLEQTQQLILANLPALGAYAEDKGAINEYNALMVAIGHADDQFTEEDDKEESTPVSSVERSPVVPLPEIVQKTQDNRDAFLSETVQ